MPDADVKAAIVIPAYKHPGLMIETLASAFEQKAEFPFAVVVVNDGCPFRETDSVCREFSSSNPNMYYIRHANRGLSGARNVGMDFCLTAFENLDAIQFLDADDGLYPGMLRKLYQALASSGPEAGWAFTDKNEFGFDIFSDLGPNHNPGEHLIRNVTPASSMASRRMLDAGARFDETMKLGMEDWDFWLQGVALGFRGVHVPAAGLRYRHRAESMSGELTIQGDYIRDYVYNKHATLFSPNSLLAHEIRWLPRFAIVTPGSDRVRYVTDPDDDAIDVDLASFHDRLCRAPHRPEPGLLPPFVVILDPEAEGLIVRLGLMRSALWNLQRAASNCRFSVLFLDRSPSEGVTVEYTVPTPIQNHCPSSAVGLMIATDALMRMTANAPQSPSADAVLPPRSPVVPQLTIRAPAPTVALPARPPRVAETFERLVSDLSSRWIGDGLDCWSAAQFDRHRAGPIRPERLYPRALDVPAVLPLRPIAERRCAVVIAMGEATVDAAAIETVVRGQSRHGWEVHLVILGGARVVWDPLPGLAALPTLLFPMLLRGAEGPALRTSSYFGSVFRRTTTDVESRQEFSFTLGALMVFDRVVLVGCESLFIVGLLGRTGVEILMLADAGTLDAIDTATASYGGLTSLLGALAFEHALTGIIPGGEDIASLLKGLGVPDNKIWREGTAE